MGKDRKLKKGKYEEDFGEEGVDNEQLLCEDEPNIPQASANKRRKPKKNDEEIEEVTLKTEELSLDISSSGQKSKSLNRKGDKKSEDVKIKESDTEDDEKESKKLTKKSKKPIGKKGKVGDDDDDDSITDNYSKLNKKKGRRGKDELVEDEVGEDNKFNKKKQKGKKGSVDVSDEDEQLLSKEMKTNRKTRRGKDDASNENQELAKEDSKMSGKKVKETINKINTIDDNDSQKISKKKNKKDTKKSHELTESDDDNEPTKKNVKSKSVFELLSVEDVDMGSSDDGEDSDKDAEQAAEKIKSEQKKQVYEEQDEQLDKSKEGGKKSKKRDKRRKQDDDDEEVQRMLEELALEIEGKKPLALEKEKERTPESVEQDIKTEEQEKSTKQKKKKKKKGEMDVQPNEKDLGDSESVAADGEKEDQGIKTAAQKKKEKKEREKQKKLAQNAQERKKTTDTSEEAACTAISEPIETKTADQEEEIASVPEDVAALDEGDDEDSKKKKKKKKKGEEEEKKDKKRPGKKQILAMQEALKKMKEEEEKRKLEEEAKRIAEEEAERKRQEQLKLEQERKERKKQKEKEKRERLKAEGKLLTKSQKQARARMEATLSALRLQGVEVPQIGEKRERAPRLGDRRKPTKKKYEDSQSEQKDISPTEEIPLPKVEVEIVGTTEHEEKKDDDKEESIKESWEDNDEDVKEAWDETTDEEREDRDKECSTPEDKDSISQPSVTKKEESDESDEDDYGSESEEDDSEEESSEESNDEEDKKKEKIKEKVHDRIQRRREEAEKKRSTDKLRSPVVCVLGHVDTGKTKILDKIRRTHVQDNEAGGITQQIGATMVPQEALKEQCKMVKNFPDMEVKLPGLLIIDTPGHESFSNLRSRGSSLCDIAILVVDIMHGLEPQTLESLNLLKQKKTPFVVALNKIDRLYDWKSSKNKDIQDVIKSQARNTKNQFEERVQIVVLQFAEQGLNAALSFENKDTRTYISMVPTSAFTGEGMGNLMALIVDLSQTMMAKRLAFSEELQATVLEVKAIPGLGTTIDVILVNGRLRESDTIVVAGQEGPVVTQIRSLLMPEPLKELRVKNPYNEYKEVEGAQGVKIAAKDLEKAIAGLQLLVAYQHDEVELLKEEVANSLRDAINSISIKLAERGVYVQASTLGSLEALLDFLQSSKIPYSGVRIGPVVKKDVMKASIMLEHEAQFAVILAFDVKVERDAEELADSLGVKIFQANIIYHLFDRFTAYQLELQQKKRDEYKHVAVFPCKLRILPQYIFNSRDPIVIGVSVEAGVVREGTPLCVPSRECLEIGTVTTLELNHKTVDSARKGQEICIKIEPLGGESPKMYGRHFDDTDVLVSKISRQSIDACKNYFRDDLQKSDWQLMVELKKLFQIM